MDTAKEVVSFLGAVLSLIAALIPLLAYLADRKRREGRSNDSPPPSANRVSEAPVPIEKSAVEPRLTAAPRVDPVAFEQIRLLVRRPAMVMLAVGGLGLMTNLFVAGVGFIDAFVTPLGIKASGRDGPAGRLETRDDGMSHPAEVAGFEDRSALLGFITILGCSLVSVVSIWSAYSMLNLRNYWLAVAGSVAVMPGSCMCCLLGVPAGIWSLVVLLRPEVAAVFR